MYRYEIQASILAINMRDKLRHDAFKFGRVCKGRRGDLDHDDIPDPLGVILEKFLESTKLTKFDLWNLVVNELSSSECTHLLEDTFDDIKLVPADNDLLAFIKRTQSLKLRLDPRTHTCEPHQRAYMWWII